MNRHLLPPNDRQRDEGSALVFALFIIIFGSLLITPLLGYARSVTRNSEIEQSKTARAEAVKGGLRTVLANPKDFYTTCANSGLHTEKVLASPGLDLDVKTVCTTVKNSMALSAAQLRVAMTTVQAGSTAPVGTVGNTYSGLGSTDINNWVDDTSLTTIGGKILLPQLPDHALSHPSSVGYQMPSWVGSCRVFFPGTYVDPITISDSQSTYFASGIYYFENTVTFTGSANVVIGGGAVDGCTNDQDAAYNAINAPLNHNITGYGATFILGAAGRIVMNDSVAASVAGTGPSVTFNNRLVNDTDIGNLPSRGVSIISVDGVANGSNQSSGLNLSNQLFVPKSMATATPPVDAASTGYAPSTLVPTVAPAVQTNAIIDFSFTGTNTATLFVPGYVAVPQGRININVTAASAAKKTISLVGGVLAALFTQSATAPATQQLGIVNQVIQKTFKGVSSTTSGRPVIVSTALVQINDFGDYVVNSWDISTAIS
ncbi:MAG: hypothetical protein WCI22_03630 [Actinomycetota bacterium]